MAIIMVHQVGEFAFPMQSCKHQHKQNVTLGYPAVLSHLFYLPVTDTFYERSFISTTEKKWLLLWYIRLESLPSQCRVVNINTNKMLLWVILQFYHIYFTSLSQILSMLWSISLVCSSCVYSALHA